MPSRLGLRTLQPPAHLASALSKSSLAPRNKQPTVSSPSYPIKSVLSVTLRAFAVHLELLQHPGSCWLAIHSTRAISHFPGASFEPYYAATNIYWFLLTLWCQGHTLHCSSISGGKNMYVNSRLFLSLNKSIPWCYWFGPRRRC